MKKKAKKVWTTKEIIDKSNGYSISKLLHKEIRDKPNNEKWIPFEKVALLRQDFEKLENVNAIKNSYGDIVEPWTPEGCAVMGACKRLIEKHFGKEHKERLVYPKEFIKIAEKEAKEGGKRK